MSAETNPDPIPENWLPDLLRSAKLSEQTSLETIKDKMARLAGAAAPVAGSWWNWMILIQGVCIAVPLLWLTRSTLNVSPTTTALSTLAAVLLFAISLWWMRWRGMQRTWARARLVAEVARSQIAASVCPEPLELRPLEIIPAIQPLLKYRDSSRQKNWPDWKQAWIADRLEGQLKYYRAAKEKAEKTRHRFTRLTTLCMDVTLAFAVAGVIVSFSNHAPRLFRLLGEHKNSIECVLGIAGVLLPLGIVLLQSLRHLQELNRRTALFAQQITMLEKARQQLDQAPTSEAAMQIVETTEQQLLAEVVDWHFEAETAERFFQVRQGSSVKPKHAPPVVGFLLRPVYWLWLFGGVGLFFVVRAVLGRAPWVVAAAALTLGWLSHVATSSPESRGELGPLGEIVDVSGDPWSPVVERITNGCMIIVHGLHDGEISNHPLNRENKEGIPKPSERDKNHWMLLMSRALHERLGAQVPNIGLVDWAGAANPAEFNGISLKIAQTKFIGDVAAIRPEALEVGDYLAFRLAQLILEKKIDPARPLHLIGHSAGGFVAARAAITLRKMNLAPERMHVTILDTPPHTPARNEELLDELPKVCSVDFYITSDFAPLLDEKAPLPGIHVKRIGSAPRPSLLHPIDLLNSNLAAHSYAHQWFTGTIPTAKAGEDGFGRSPFAVEASKP